MILYSGFTPVEGYGISASPQGGNRQIFGQQKGQFGREFRRSSVAFGVAY